MTAQQYIDFVNSVRDEIAVHFVAALGTDVHVEKRYIAPATNSENEWLAHLKKPNSEAIRTLVLTYKDFTGSSEGRTAGAKNFKPQITVVFDLFHDYTQGTDAQNSEAVFMADVLKLQFAIETHRNLVGGKARVDSYLLPVGIRPSAVQAVHYCAGEMTLNLSEVRYE